MQTERVNVYSFRQFMTLAQLGGYDIAANGVTRDAVCYAPISYTVMGVYDGIAKRGYVDMPRDLIRAPD